jgi:hypothetical protein
VINHLAVADGVKITGAATTEICSLFGEGCVLITAMVVWKRSLPEQCIRPAPPACIASNAWVAYATITKSITANVLVGAARDVTI